MDVSAVGSSISPQLQPRPQGNTASTDYETVAARTSATKSADEERKTQQADNPPPAENGPKPVVNAQGQVTGRVISTVA